MRGTLGSLAEFLAVPPINLLLLALIGLAISWRHRRAGGTIATVAVVALTVLAMPVTSKLLYASLERGLPTGAPAAPPGAIVVLGGDARRTPDNADLMIGPLSLERVRAAAALHRATGLPLLVTGGRVDAVGPPIATLMARSLTDDFAEPPRWVEARSIDTWDNARLSAVLLRADGIGTVYVVTQAWHMKRALLSFAATGIVAVPAPTRIDAPPVFTLSEFVPLATAWTRSYYALHEWIGCAWYAWRH